MPGDTGSDVPSTDGPSAGGPFALLASRQQLVWAAAILLYGVGDTATTFWGLTTGGIAEAGPVAAPLIETYGRLSLLVVKAATFSAFYLLWRVVRTPGRVAVPLALATVGALVTVWNVLVVASA